MIIVTYIDKRTGDEEIVKFARTPKGTKGSIANNGMRRLFGKKWKLRYVIANVTDDDPPKEDDEALEENDE